MVNFHIVRSVKGGSGKTAFSLRLVINMLKENLQNLRNLQEVEGAEATLIRKQTEIQNKLEEQKNSGKPEAELFTMKQQLDKVCQKIENVHRQVEELKKKERKKVLYIDADVHASDTRDALFSPSGRSFFKYIDTKVEKGECYFSFYDSRKPNQQPDDYDEADAQKKEKEKHSLNTYIHPYNGYYSKLSELPIKGRLICQENNPALGTGEAVLIKDSDVGVPVEVAASGTPADIATGNGSRERIELKPSDQITAPDEAFFVFSDPTPEGRNVFGSLFQSAGKSAVGVGAYSAKLKTLFEYISKEDYTDIVVDMPPGSDTFSEHLMDTLASFICKPESRNALQIYYIATGDNAHKNTAAHAAIEHLHLMRTASPLKVNYVWNIGIHNEPELVDPARKIPIKNRSDLIALLKKVFEDDLTYDLERLEYSYFLPDDVYRKSAQKEDGLKFSDNNLIVYVNE